MAEELTELTVDKLLGVSRPQGANHVHVLLRLSTGLELRLIVPDTVAAALGGKLVVQAPKAGFY